MKRVAGKINSKGMEFGLQRHLEKAFDNCIKHQLKEYPPSLWLDCNDDGKVKVKIFMEAFADEYDILVWEHSFEDLLKDMLENNYIGWNGNLYLRKNDLGVNNFKSLLQKYIDIVNKLQSKDPESTTSQTP
jgi:hypothetical protein